MRIRFLAHVVELAAVAAMVIAVATMIAFPSARDDLALVALGGLVAASAMLFVRCGVGLISYAVLIVVVMPAVSYWGFMVRGDSRVMASTTSLVRAGLEDASVAFVSLYMIGLALSFLSQLHSEQLDQQIVASAVRAGRAITGLENWVFSMVALAAAYVYQPSMPGLGYRQIEYNLVAGHAWNYVCLTAYVFLLPSPRKTIVTWAALIGVPLWLLLHFDRADILGLGVLWLLVAREYDIGRGQRNWRKGRAGAALFFVAALVLLFAYIGAIRDVGLVWKQDLFVDTFRTLLNYPTVQSVNHSFAAAIEYVSRLGPASMIGDYPARLVPSFLVEHPVSAEVIVQQGIGTNFGMYLAGEFYLQYGSAGAIVGGILAVSFMAICCLAMKRVFGAPGVWGWYAISVLMVVRIGWYGLFYYVKVMIIVLPTLLLFHLIVDYVARVGYAPKQTSV